MAANRSHKESFSLVLEAGAGIHATDQFKKTALMYAIKGGNVAIVPQLLSFGTNVHACASDAYAVPSQAIDWGYLEAVR